MCYAFYIGTDAPLQTSEWDKDSPGFYLRDLNDRDEPVRAYFSKPNVYYAGSHLGCGCGLFNNGILLADNPDEMKKYEEAQRSPKALVALLHQILASSDTVELYVTWEGRQSEPPVRKRTMTPEEFICSPVLDGKDNNTLIAFSTVDEQDFVVLRKQA